jgi:NhaP-type Na+/H+ or K+/H+ antiporter
MSVTHWSLFLGVLLITMVLSGTLLARLPLSAAMVYLAVGFGVGPAGLGVLQPDPMRHAAVLEGVAEVAVLISLFTVGLKLEVPLLDRRWLLPLGLAFVSMAITVGLIALVAVWGLHLSLGAAVLLGAILAPTDPVLASGVQANAGADPDRVRFSLAGEGALNDGTVFPFVILGLGLMGLHDFGSVPRWWIVDFVWTCAAGLAIGAAAGMLIGWLVVRLRTRYRQALGLDEFLSLGLISVAYGAAQSCAASGFLAVFAAGLALQRVKEQPRAGTESVDRARAGGRAAKRATRSHRASASMSRAVQGFNEQLEKLAELTIVLIVGAMLPYTSPTVSLLWFVPVFFVVLRPLAVAAVAYGATVPRRERALMSWFGIRGIGSVFYLMFAIHHGVGGAVANELVTLTLVTVAASIFVHGASASALMKRYSQHGAAPR